MKAAEKQVPEVRPLISEERMREIVSSPRSITSEEFKKQVETHLGRRRPPVRKTNSSDGRNSRASC
ncbi:MAG: hypothetical protein H7A49_17480 [Akkermansiaceae bacterium]|nr:hypothetical protein [Akkermansiaceae bacterium]MCP5545689.1 hypothetical protein [Akkermansiaceae bacterium]